MLVRIADIFVALLALLALAPVLFFALAILRIVEGGPVLRISGIFGRKGHSTGYHLYSLSLEEQDSLEQVGMGLLSITDFRKQHPGVSRFMEILVRTRINQILCLLNVIKGDWTFFGSTFQYRPWSFEIDDATLNIIEHMRHDDHFLQNIEHVPAPGKWAMFITQKLFSCRQNVLVFEQVIHDMREEHFEALQCDEKWHARWIAVRGHLALALSAFHIVLNKCLAPIEKLASELRKLCQ